MNSIEKLTTLGNPPLPRFGHSITTYAKDKVCLFGGATGVSGQFSITDNTFILDLLTKIWRKVQTTGISPTARAAHAAVCIETNKIVLYGGATGSGGLASDQLFHLDIKQGVGIWNTINCGTKTPGKRYGHSLIYNKPSLIVFGGNIGDRTVNDVWILNIQQKPLTWNQLRCSGQVPPPRVYHSAALCSTGHANGMIIIFGGRANNNQPLNDCWGFRRHTNKQWDWIRAPSKTTPLARYQHTGLCIGTLMLIVGGKTNNVSEILPLQIYDTQTSEWFSYGSIQRFRHGSWIYQKNLYVYGGFQLSSPTLPTDTIFRVNLAQIFKNNANLYNKVTQMNTSSSSNLSTISAKSDRSDNSQTSDGSRIRQTTPKKQQQKRPILQPPLPPKSQSSIIPTNKKKKKLTMLQPLIGNPINKNKYQLDIKKQPSPKQDVAPIFLSQLLHPKDFLNTQHIKINFKIDQILTLCDLTQDIIIKQPMVLNVKAPIKIFGDIHGQFSDLMSFFNLYGAPHLNGEKKDIEHFDYIFLGDFVDRGSHSLQTICLLLALKVIYPEQIHLIRGNHQDSQINLSFGFRDECAQKLDQDPQHPNSVFNRLNRLFDWLPLAAIAQQKILCLHGGIGASLKTIKQIQNIRRPLQVMHEVQDEESQLVLDILWSDPTDTDNQLGIQPNYLRDPQQSGNIVKFGPDRVHEFLKNNNLNLLIRAHQCVMDGFERFAGGSLITVFSATDYCHKHKNAGAILIIKTNLQIIPKLIYPMSNNVNNWIEDEQQLQKRPPTPPRWRQAR